MTNSPLAVRSIYPLSSEQLRQLVGSSTKGVFGCTAYTGDGQIHHVTIINGVGKCDAHGADCEALASVRTLYDTTHPASKEG